MTGIPGRRIILDSVSLGDLKVWLERGMQGWRWQAGRLLGDMSNDTLSTTSPPSVVNRIALCLAILL